MSNMNHFHEMAIIALCCGRLASSSTVKDGLRNKHLTIAGDFWHPFLSYDWGLYSNATTVHKAEGIMWDLLKFMQKTRNFTFTLVKPSKYEWGDCYAIDNFTGLLGMVNRGEADFALGK